MKSVTNFVKDTFYYDDRMYVVLDNLIDAKSGNKLLLARVIFGEKVAIEELSQEEYAEVADYYLTLLNAIYDANGEVENG